jgi:hypothetical protein
MNGKLLYKRWFNLGYGKVFCDVWGNRPFSANDSYESITEVPAAETQDEATQRLIQIDEKASGRKRIVIPTS